MKKAHGDLAKRENNSDGRASSRGLDLHTAIFIETTRWPRLDADRRLRMQIARDDKAESGRITVEYDATCNRRKIRVFPSV